MRQKWLLFAQVDKAVTRAILTPGTHLPRVSRCWPEYQRRPGVEAKRDDGGNSEWDCAFGPVLGDQARHPAPQTRRDQKARKRNGDRGERMAEEQAEAVDEADLDQEKGKTKQQEIECDAPPCRHIRRSPVTRQGGEWKEDQNDRSHDSLHLCQKADEIAAVDKYEPALSA